jgi:hypothetical protein
MDWPRLVAEIIAPASVVAAIAFLGRSVIAQLLQRGSLSFENALERRWTVQQMIQDAIVSAYDQLDMHRREFTDLIDQEIISEMSDTKGIRQFSSFSRVEALVRLWLPSLDDPLARLKNSVRASHNDYHDVILTLMQVRGQVPKADESDTDMVAQSIPNSEDRRVYFAILESVRKTSTQQLVSRLRQYPEIAQAFPGDIDFSPMSISILEKLLKRSALALVSTLDRELEAFKQQLAIRSREFVAQNVTHE